MTNIVTTESGEKFTLFYTIRSPFSNFYPCSFTIYEDIGNGKPEERRYYSTEQYYMYHKALSAGDSEMADQIACEKSARKIKMMSRNIKNFERETWNKLSGDVMRRGNFAKYTQNEFLRQRLFYTYGSTLVECSPTDIEWGIGLDINEPDALSPAKWRGKNKLGHILTEIREELWSRPEYAKEVNDILSMLENFETFSRKFFLPPKPRIQQVSRPPPDGSDGDYDKRRSLPSSMDIDRNNGPNSDKRRSLPSYPCAERLENIGDSGSRKLSGAKAEDDFSMPSRERRARSPPRSSRKRHYRHSPSYDREYGRRRSSSGDSISRERNNFRSGKRKVTSSSSRSQHDVKSRRGKRRSGSESDRESSRFPKRQRRTNGFDVESSRSSEWRRRHKRGASLSSGEESSSSADEVQDEEVKKALADPFKSLLERLRRKQCGMWERNAAECNGNTNRAIPVDD